MQIFLSSQLVGLCRQQIEIIKWSNMQIFLCSQLVGLCRQQMEKELAVNYYVLFQVAVRKQDQRSS